MGKGKEKEGGGVIMYLEGNFLYFIKVKTLIHKLDECQVI
jgi:hypothetical protein